MSTIGQKERATQQRLVALFQNPLLGYDYYGDWQDRAGNASIEEEYLRAWLVKAGVDTGLITNAIRQFKQAASMGDGKKLYHANKEVYSLLRYGVKVRQGQGENTKTVWLIDWKHPHKNDFAIAEEVSVKGPNSKRPDIVIYVNGIALGVIELKRSSVSVTEGIRQNLDNQKKTFIRDFFSTMQLVMAGNDTEGLRYGTIETPEKHYYHWKEENPDYIAEIHERSQKHLSVEDVDYADELLDFDIINLCRKERFLELIHNFIVFDAGVKKTCRHNQYFSVKASQVRLGDDEGGIIWHTQGSGKSLTMVWLAKWLRENVLNARVLVVTDRTELDEQIEGVFAGVDEEISRSKNGAGLIAELNQAEPWLLCSLVHKFGRQQDDAESADDKVTDAFFDDILKNLPSDFKAKGNLFVFVDECHRTQSGKLHSAMKAILPDAIFIGFTGTPLLKKDKQKSIEIFGSFIHTYKFDEAVADGVVLDLQYEARDIDQYIRSQTKIDDWFEVNTKGLTDMAKVQLKQKWGTMQKVLSSQSRLEMIVNDIWLDMKRKPRLMDGRGNAMLVCASIYQACKVYELFGKTELKGKCAIVTSYLPSAADLKGEESGEGQTEKIHQFEIYQQMLADYFEVPKEDAIHRAEDFEKKVKAQFKKEPGQMRLLIVVDKLLTGFDAPSATYLYIDKKMQDHGLFQAICRVNRLDGDDKEYGYIVDYKDLFHSLETSIGDYTSGAFDDYDKDDVKGLLSNRLETSKDKLEEVREATKALCEPVLQPKELIDYIRYFCGDVANSDDLRLNEAKRVALYRNVAAFVRAYSNMANEMEAAGYSGKEALAIKGEVEHFSKMRQEIKLASGDEVDMKQYEPAMRRLLDIYINADDSETVVDFEELGLIELIVEKAKLNPAKASGKKVPEAMAETIENNIRKVIIDEQPINPKYYEKMSELLDALIGQRREEAISYATYLQEVKALAGRITQPEGTTIYPSSVDSRGKQALYDNYGKDEIFVAKIDTAVHTSRKADWKGNTFKTRSVRHAVEEQAAGYKVDVDGLMDLIKNQSEYD
ncbi:type I restriction endonuclease subunit R [Zhongshania marina]|uniref:Type I restriction enzyme endonuclease subunit n=1 Tax=Zhongshania marina TaxID=2304603 RepID=A0ABX9W3L5_9GAMM|nr:type I restriction endonuclease subunit R [Zhongshania marina]